MAERTRRRAAGSGTSSRRARNEDAGGRLSRDFTDEEYREPSEGYQGEQPTRGLYTAELVDLRDHTSQDGNESLRWMFRLADGSKNKHGDDVSGWPDSQYTTEASAWKEQQMLVALGVIKPGGKVNLGYAAIVKKAKPCTVRVGTERYIPEDGGDPETRGRMEAFLPLRDTARPKAKRAKDDDADEDVFDDDAEDEDGDDDADEEPPARSRRSTSRSRRKAAEPEPEDEDEEEDPEDEDEEGEEEDYDPDALAAELEDLSLAALKKRAREEFGVKITRGMKADAIIDAVIDTLGDEGDAEDEDEDEDGEEEPPPPPRARSARNSKSASTAGRGTRGSTRRKRGSTDDPPF